MGRARVSRRRRAKRRSGVLLGRRMRKAAGLGVERARAPETAEVVVVTLVVAVRSCGVGIDGHPTDRVGDRRVVSTFVHVMGMVRVMLMTAACGGLGRESGGVGVEALAATV